MPTYLFSGTLVLRKVWNTLTITIKVHSPGTYLHNRDDVYIFVNIFDSIHYTKLSEPNFPLEVHESFSFEKVLSSYKEIF